MYFDAKLGTHAAAGVTRATNGGAYTCLGRCAEGIQKRSMSCYG